MNGIVYTIVAFGGHWASEDDWHRTIAASYCKRSATNEIKRLVEIQRIAKEIHEKVKAFRHGWEQAQPFEHHEYRLSDIPKWPAGIHMNQITPAMRAERETIKERNQAIVAEHDKQYTKYRNRLDTACSEFRKSLDYPQEIKDAQFSSFDTEYNIEEVQWLPPDTSVLKEAETATAEQLEQYIGDASTQWIRVKLVEIRARRFPNEEDDDELLK